MTITELIAKLEAVNAEHGDLPVAVVDQESMGGLFDADDVTVKVESLDGKERKMAVVE